MVALAGGVPDGGELIEEAPERLGDGTYAFAGAMAFLELSSLLGVLLPFEVGVVLSGAVAGEGEIAFVPLAVVVWGCTAAGQCVNFWCGRRYGRPFIVDRGPRFGVTPPRLARIERHFERRGAVIVLLAPFVPLVRSSAPFVAGSSLMRWSRFVAFIVPGSLAWAVAFCGLGYGFYRSADRVAEIVGSAGLIALGLVVVAAAALYLLRRRRTRVRLAERRAGD